MASVENAQFKISVAMIDMSWTAVSTLQLVVCCFEFFGI